MNRYANVRILCVMTLVVMGLSACSQSDTPSTSISSADPVASESVLIQSRLFLVESEAWLSEQGIRFGAAGMDRLDDLQVSMLAELADISAEAVMHQAPALTIDADAAPQRIVFRKTDTGLPEDVAVNFDAQVSASEQAIALTVEPYAARVSLPDRATGVIRLPLDQARSESGHESRLAYLLVKPSITGQAP